MVPNHVNLAKIGRYFFCTKLGIQWVSRSLITNQVSNFGGYTIVDNYFNQVQFEMCFKVTDNNDRVGQRNNDNRQIGCSICFNLDFLLKPQEISGYLIWNHFVKSSLSLLNSRKNSELYLYWSIGVRKTLGLEIFFYELDF